jgi:hypothetical protein
MGAFFKSAQDVQFRARLHGRFPEAAPIVQTQLRSLISFLRHSIAAALRHLVPMLLRALCCALLAATPRALRVPRRAVLRSSVAAVAAPRVAGAKCADIETCRELGDAKVAAAEAANPTVRLADGVRYKQLKAGAGPALARGDVADVAFSISSAGGSYMYSRGLGFEKDAGGNVQRLVGPI